MADGFEKRLLDLLPPLYLEQDKTGDLQTFLKLPAASLDELKDLIDRFPAIFDVDRCDLSYLPLLGELVGYAYDPLADIPSQRRQIREAIEVYRRKATIPAIGRSLTDLGWQGEIEETFHSALRLNRRAKVSNAKLPGLIYSLGVYRVESDNLIQGIRQELPFHHPAGTRTFFRQWLYTLLSMESFFETTIKQVVERVCLGHLHETFVVNHNQLNTDFHLTRKNKNWGGWRVTNSTTLLQDIEQAGSCISRWLGRKDGMRLNNVSLGQKRLPGLHIDSRKFALCCEISTEPPVLHPVHRLAGQELNRTRLNKVKSSCRIKFRQQDLYSEASQELAIPQADGRGITYAERLRMSQAFTANHSRLGQVKIPKVKTIKPFFLVTYAEAQWSEVRESYDLVNRWRGRQPGFGLNGKSLNTALTNSQITDARASFEIKIDTGFPRRHRVEPLNLGKAKLNHTGLRLSMDRTRPMRLGFMPLNGAGLRLSQSDIRWRIKPVNL
jgi:phage tail-like protein